MPLSKLNQYSSHTPFNLTTFSFEHHILERPHAPALLIVDENGNDATISFEKLYQQICQLAAGLSSLNFPAQSTIAIHTPDPLDIILLFYAGIAESLIVVPLLYSMTDEEVNFVLDNANCKAIFTQHTSLKCKENSTIISPQALQTLKNFPPKELLPTTKFNDPAYIFYTSGSTGNPKGVIHAQHVILGRLPSIEYWLELSNTDIVLCTENICWTYSMAAGVLDPLLVGATALIYTPINFSATSEDKIHSSTWLDLINHYQVTVMAASPDIYEHILALPDIQSRSIPSLKQAGSAGAPLSEKIQNDWLTVFHFPIYPALGMSELSTFISTGRRIPPIPGKLGKIQPGRQVKILPLTADEDQVPIDTPGILAINKDELGFMLGYVNDTDKKQYRGNWFLTSDLVSQDQAGYLTYYGREDMVFKVEGGYRVSPIEVENKLKNCAHVIEALCGCETDANEGNHLVAYVQLDKEINQEKLMNIFNELKTYLSDYKIPQKIYVVDKFFYNARGKILRKKIQDLHVLACQTRD